MPAPTYHEHVSKAPEFEVIEYVPAPDAEACALRVALTRVTEERNQWREAYLKLQRQAAAGTNQIHNGDIVR
jgi:hypothetical protein